MVKWIGGLGFLHSRHCEKVSYLTTGAIALFVILAYQAIAVNYVPEIQIAGNTLSLVLAVGIVALGGYGGVIFYKVTNNKPLKLKTIIFFWLDK
jgi:hypothetical protein